MLIRELDNDVAIISAPTPLLPEKLVGSKDVNIINSLRKHRISVAKYHACAIRCTNRDIVRLIDHDKEGCFRK